MHRLFLAFALSLSGAVAALADDLPAPQGPVVLTVSGAISHSNGNGVAQFDQAMLDALPQRTTVTKTPWYEGPQTFSGPLMSGLLEAVGATGETIKVTALNDYSADIPLQDVLSYPVILADRLDDTLLSVRDKGPLFVIYPFDEFRELYDEVHFGQSVWQINAIVVK